MIFHKHKLIYIHIPKCAGSSIGRFYSDDVRFNWKEPNYEFLYGWCPKRKIHMQHATSKQLLELELISKDQWKEYFKFTVVRNPWDRCYSDYLWMMQDTNIKGTFKEYITRSGRFKGVLNDTSTMFYRGDHLTPQTNFYSSEGDYKVDFVGRFENLLKTINFINKKIHSIDELSIHEKKNKNKFAHYSSFYTKSKMEYVRNFYNRDIEVLDYQFEDKKKGLKRLKNLI